MREAGGVAERREDNSPAIHGWEQRHPDFKVPSGTAERFWWPFTTTFRPWRDFGGLRKSNPSHEWLGYVQVKQHDAESRNREWYAFQRCGRCED